MQEDRKSAASRKVIRDVTKRHDFFFKKGLGQNFLTDDNIVEKIVASLEPAKSETVLEVGPGMGSLTQKLARDFKRVYCVEIDTRAVGMLEEMLSGFDNVSIVNADILKTDLEDILKDEIENGSVIKFISNLPYYITSPIIMKVLESGIDFGSIIIMTQKEVADRLSADMNTKDYSSFTVMVNYYADVTRLFNVPKTVFIPSPKVDSTVIRLVPRKRDDLGIEDEKLFAKTVRASFINRRKMAYNSIANTLGLDKKAVKTAMENAGINPGARAENISIEQFAALANELKKITAL